MRFRIPIILEASLNQFTKTAFPFRVVIYVNPQHLSKQHITRQGVAFFCASGFRENVFKHNASWQRYTLRWKGLCHAHF